MFITEAQRKLSTTHVSITIHPLLSSEIAQEEGKLVSSDQPQQIVFERIVAEKLNKALESSQLMGKLEIIPDSETPEPMESNTDIPTHTYTIRVTLCQFFVKWMPIGWKAC